MLVIPDFVLPLALLVLGVAAVVMVVRARRNRWLAIGAVATIGCAIVLYRYTYDCVVVEDDGKGGLRADRALVIGEPAHDPQWVVGKNPTWIINRSSRVVVHELDGPGSEVYVDKSSYIKAGEVGAESRVDYIGPGDRPPARALEHASVIWLRWK